MSCYVDLAIDVTKLPKSDKIKEISDLTNAILAAAEGFSYKKSGMQARYEGESYMFKINKINWSKYIEKY